MHHACLHTCARCAAQHDESEYGEHVEPASGAHSGGPFRVRVRGDVRVEELRRVLRVR